MNTSKEKIDITVITGPTASGKTAFAIELALKTGSEIVSADSMQIYREMNIGTAKPTKEEMRGVVHHLIDFVDISETFSVADYVRLARMAIEDISSRGKGAILAGGTGLYITSLINNIEFNEKAKNSSIRIELYKRLETEGVDRLLLELSEFDKESAQRIHKNDTLRIVRAIEQYLATGVTMTEQIKKSRNQSDWLNATLIALNYKNRNTLYDRINKRVDTMIDQGLVEEARYILGRSDCSQTARNAICYKELEPYINGEISIEDASEKLKLATRRYSKRQLTWFRKDSRVTWVYKD